MLFCSGKSRFGSKPREGKEEFTVPLRLTPVARRVAACGPPCGFVGRRWGTDTPSLFGRVLGSFSVRRKRSRRKGRRRGRPAPVTSAHSAGSFTGSATGVVKWLFRWAVGTETEKAS